MNICVYGAASQQIHTDFLQGAHQLGHCPGESPASAWSLAVEIPA